MSIQDEEEVKKCYINYLDVFTCYYKTARVPKQEHSPVLDIPTEIVEEDKEYTCLTSRQCDIAEIKAPSMETANRKGKAKRIEHFGVKLEDINEVEDPDSQQFHPTQPNNERGPTLNKDIQTMIKTSTISEPADKEDNGSTSSDDLVIISVYNSNKRPYIVLVYDQRPTDPKQLVKLVILVVIVKWLISLPEDILSQILSLMLTKFAVRTSILSKRWRYTWALIHSLDFDDILPIVNKVVLNVSNLEYLFEDGDSCPFLVMENLASLVEAKVFGEIRYIHLLGDFLEGISGVKSLYLSFKYPYWRDSPVVNLPKFPNLKYLKLNGDGGAAWNLIHKFLESSSELEHLSIEKSVPTCMLMNLKTMEYDLIKARKCNIDFLKFMLGNSKVLKKLTITCRARKSLKGNERFCARLSGLPKASSCPRHIDSSDTPPISLPPPSHPSLGQLISIASYNIT
ncbi:ARID DNA-binding domain-containing protein [Tanacetum coccineum]